MIRYLNLDFIDFDFSGILFDGMENAVIRYKTRSENILVNQAF